jgi:hypothetical protein
MRRPASRLDNAVVGGYDSPMTDGAGRRIGSSEGVLRAVWAKLAPGGSADIAGIQRLAEPDFVARRQTAKRARGTSKATHHVIIHEAEDAAGKVVRTVEKRAYNDIPTARTNGESFFFERILPLWPEARAVAPQPIAVRHGWITSTLHISFVEGQRLRLGRYLLPAAKLVARLQLSSLGLAERPEIAGAPGFRSLVYFDLPRWRRFRGNYRRYIRQLRRGDMGPALPPTDWNALAANLDRLAAETAAGPLAFCHLDLLTRNFRVSGRNIRLIDWGNAAFAPLGADLGALISSAFFRMEPREFETASDQFWAQLRGLPGIPAPEREAMLRGAYLFLVMGALFHLRRLFSRKRLPLQDRRRLKEKVEAFVALARPLTVEGAELSAAGLVPIR